MSLNRTNNEPNDEGMKKTVKKLKTNEASLDIAGELLKIVHPLPEFKNNFLNFMKPAVTSTSPKRGWGERITY